MLIILFNLSGFTFFFFFFCCDKLVSCCEKLIFVFEFNERMRKGSKEYQKQRSSVFDLCKKKNQKKKKKKQR
jgi:hypothetical protein